MSSSLPSCALGLWARRTSFRPPPPSLCLSLLRVRPLRGRGGGGMRLQTIGPLLRRVRGDGGAGPGHDPRGRSTAGGGPPGGRPAPPLCPSRRCAGPGPVACLRGARHGHSGPGGRTGVWGGKAQAARGRPPPPPGYGGMPRPRGGAQGHCALLGLLPFRNAPSPGLWLGALWGLGLPWALRTGGGEGGRDV